jgi:hypothetical protein
MEKDFRTLISVLEKEIMIHDALIGTASLINQNIRKNELTELQKNNDIYDEQIGKLEETEEERTNCCSRITSSLGIPIAAPVRISSFIEHIPEQFHSRVESLRSDLKKKLGILIQFNTSNRILIEESLGAIENMFFAIRQSTKKLTGYGQRGHKAYSSASCAMINKTI